MAKESERKELEKKITRYETHLNEVLRKDLEKCLELRDKIYTEQAEFLALRNSITTIKEAGLKENETLHTKVDLGCNFYCQAEVESPQRIMVAVGMGFFLEMTLDEALQYVSRKEKELTEKAEELTTQSINIKANIKLVICGLKELQSISTEPSRQQFRDVFS
eukprot:TRINITY_DN3878_c0_g1_i10.p1 TRINITY_DN3878_c0_g1~~TRINITY_DN3878_c0_g1_i10.p1  ORF type:complete len:180 (-),score=27.56 TRINITY_DN3878_c0_g1_i10:72-560(-)